jgi:hypothetical protein
MAVFSKNHSCRGLLGHDGGRREPCSFLRATWCDPGGEFLMTAQRGEVEAPQELGAAPWSGTSAVRRAWSREPHSAAPPAHDHQPSELGPEPRSTGRQPLALNRVLEPAPHATAILGVVWPKFPLEVRFLTTNHKQAQGAPGWQRHQEQEERIGEEADRPAEENHRQVHRIATPPKHSGANELGGRLPDVKSSLRPLQFSYCEEQDSH